MTTDPTGLDDLKPCPFCGNRLTGKVGKINPRGNCTTPDCFGGKLPVVNLDVPDDVEAWNRRASIGPTAAECLAMAERHRDLRYADDLWKWSAEATVLLRRIASGGGNG